MGQKSSKEKKEQEIQKKFELFEIEFLRKKFRTAASIIEGSLNF